MAPNEATVYNSLTWVESLKSLLGADSFYQVNASNTRFIFVCLNKI